MSGNVAFCVLGNVVRGMGFIIVDTDKRILILGCYQVWAGSSLKAEVLTLENVLTFTKG